MFLILLAYAVGALNFWMGADTGELIYTAMGWACVGTATLATLLLVGFALVLHLHKCGPQCDPNSNQVQ